MTTPSDAAADPGFPPRGSMRMYLDRGEHPATRLPLLNSDTNNPPAVCGNCANTVLRRLEDGSERLKCGLRARGRRRGRGPDLRNSMPACVEYAAASSSPRDT